MVKGDQNPREANGDPNTSKKKQKEDNSSAISVGSKSGKKGTLKDHSDKPHTLGAPPQSESTDKTALSRMEKSLEKLTNSVLVLTSEVSNVKQQQEQWLETDFGENPDYFSDDQDYYTYPVGGGAHASGAHGADESLQGFPDVGDSQYYDIDDPLIDSHVNKPAQLSEHNDESEKKVEGQFSFDTFLEEYSAVVEKTTDSVDEKLAAGVNSMFAKGMAMEKFKNKTAEIRRPENCSGLCSVDVEDLVWNLLQKDTKNFDKRLQIIQTAMAKSACSFTLMLDMIKKQNASSLSTDSDIAQVKTELAKLGTSGMALLGHAYHQLCLRRRELHKPDVAWKYGDLFAAEIVHNQCLYGGKEKVEEKIKDIGTTNKVAGEMFRSVARYHAGGRGGAYYYNYPGRGPSHAGPMRRGGRSARRAGRGPRGRFSPLVRGRGRAKSAPPSYNNRGEVSLNLSLHVEDNMESESVLFKAGNIEQHLHSWQRITSDQEILQTVQGATIEFACDDMGVQYTPDQCGLHRPISKFNTAQSEIVEQEIDALLRKNVIEEAKHDEGEFLSTIFLVPKKNGKYRLILNLKKFNEHVEYWHFKMETFDMAIKMLSPGCFLASIDLKDAYYSVPIHAEFRKYLRFYWNGKLYQFTCLPNGLACAPRKFTKLLKPVYATLRREGHHVSGFLDDMLLMASSETELQASIDRTLQLLQELGFVINWEKSVLVPTKKLTHLGFEIDSDSMTVTLPSEKVNNIISICQNLITKNRESIRNVAKVIGSIVACFPAVLPGPLHYRNLEYAKEEALKLNRGDFDASMTISSLMKEELTWWLDNIKTQQKSIIEPTPEVTLTSDASKEGWGGSFEEKKVGGRWTEVEQENHINYLELLGAFFVLKSFHEHIEGKQVCMLMDNTTAIAYIKHMGGKQPQLNALAKEIWAWCLSGNIVLTSSHIPGIQNTEADFASRHFNDRVEWSLHEDIFQKITMKLGSPEIDLFASRLNAKCARYVAWQKDPEAVFIDAFSRSWKDFNAYAFPPFSLIAKVLQRIQQDKAQMIVIVPLWTTQSWFTVFLELLIKNPILLPQRDNLLTLAHQRDSQHPLRKKLRLIVGQLSGMPTERQNFQSGLPASSSVHGRAERTSSTPFISDSGMHFVLKGRLIALDHL